MQQGFADIKKEQADIKEEIKKNSIRLESLEKKVDIIGEVHQNHMKQSENQHVEIVEMVSDKLELESTVEALTNGNSSFFNVISTLIVDVSIG